MGGGWRLLGRCGERGEGKGSGEVGCAGFIGGTREVRCRERWRCGRLPERRAGCCVAGALGGLGGAARCARVFLPGHSHSVGCEQAARPSGLAVGPTPLESSKDKA
eukprot:COSAG02_NODE_3361_length_6869_cov_128.775923_4_plen_106_part_00